MSDTATDLIRACPESDVHEKQLTYVEQGGRNFLVTRWDGELRAFRNLCKHQYLVMDDCPIEGDTLRCPYHTVCYSLDTGDVTDDSGFMGIEPLTRYPVRVEDGWVVMEVPKKERW